MGQIIELKTTKLNKSIILDLNRSVTGQEGMSFRKISEATLAEDKSGKLGFDLFKKNKDIKTI